MNAQFARSNFEYKRHCRETGEYDMEPITDRIADMSFGEKRQAARDYHDWLARYPHNVGYQTFGQWLVEKIAEGRYAEPPLPGQLSGGVPFVRAQA